MSNQTVESMEVSKQAPLFIDAKITIVTIEDALKTVARRTYLKRLLEEDCTYPELEDEEFDQFIDEVEFLPIGSTEESQSYAFILFDEGFDVKLIMKSGEQQNG